MSHTDWIFIIITLTFSSTFGVYVAYRKINQYFPVSPSRNVLTREGGIELQDVIDPIHSNALDIDFPQYPSSQAVINHLPIRWNRYDAPRYSELSENIINSNYLPRYSELSGNSSYLPRYSEFNENIINCPLELENFDLVIKAIQVLFDFFT